MITHSRKRLVIGTTALVGLALTACSPPNQADSDLKVETATGVAAPSSSASSSATSTSDVPAEDLPGYIDCVAAPEQQPTDISLNCADNGDQLIEIEWASWDEDAASGTATRVTTTTEGEETTTEDVEVELTFPTVTSQGLVFSQVTVNGQAIVL